MTQTLAIAELCKELQDAGKTKVLDELLVSCWGQFVYSEEYKALKLLIDSKHSDTSAHLNVIGLYFTFKGNWAEAIRVLNEIYAKRCTTLDRPTIENAKDLLRILLLPLLEKQAK